MVETDEQLIEGVINGNKLMFRKLVIKYEKRVYAVAFKTANDHSHAEDITQEVFLQVYRTLQSFKGESTFSTWIYRITVNKSLDYMKKYEKTPIQYNESPLHITNFQTPETTLLEEEHKELVHHYIDKLPLHYKEVVQLYYFEELSYNEIALQLDIARKTVETRLYRARQIMRKGMEEIDSYNQ